MKKLSDSNLRKGLSFEESLADINDKIDKPIGGRKTIVNSFLAEDLSFRPSIRITENEQKEIDEIKTLDLYGFPIKYHALCWDFFESNEGKIIKQFYFYLSNGFYLSISRLKVALAANFVDEKTWVERSGGFLSDSDFIQLLLDTNYLSENNKANINERSMKFIFMDLPVIMGFPTEYFDQTSLDKALKKGGNFSQKSLPFEYYVNKKSLPVDIGTRKPFGYFRQIDGFIMKQIGLLNRQ